MEKSEEEGKVLQPQKLRVTYLKDIMESLEWPEELLYLPLAERYKIALVVQQNLQMARMFDLLMIATGVDLEESGACPAPETNLAAIADELSEQKQSSMMCGACGKGVLPNRMGYCPKCGNDLRKQYSQEILSKSAKIRIT
jgi:NADH pyrophosphatase NudC (nudix superfamily)